MTLPMTGGCSCGAIRYEAAAEPKMSYNCHCRQCQRFTGTAYMSAFMVPVESFKITKGEPTFYTVGADSGGQISRGFCKTCGSPVMAKFTTYAGVIAIPAGSLDDPSQHKPTLDMYTSMALPWVALDPDLKKFSESPRKQA